ncbi:MAG: hypothetical protein ABIL09_07395, partial [Gemmatimonadota bacterium]
NTAMKTLPLSHQLGRRLEEIDRQIHTCLRDIRQNLAELERVSGRGETGRTAAPGRFADVLGKVMEGGSRPPTA